MKKLFLIASLFCFASCGSQNDPTPANNSNTGTDSTMSAKQDTTTMDSVVLTGEFKSSGTESVSGTARVEDKILYLENFSTNNGPDLKVYISKDMSASDYIRVGDLKADSGDQQYSLDKSIDFTKYPYVLIWCEQFTVLFGYAKLE